MKKCTYCGKEYTDDIAVCATDAQPLAQVSEQAQVDEPLKPRGAAADGTALTSENQNPTKGSSSDKGAQFLVGVILAIGLLFAGGWSPLWGMRMIPRDAFLLMDDGFALRINELYYGATFTSRFFDSPAISWVCLMLACGLTPGGVFFFASSHGKSTDLSA